MDMITVTAKTLDEAITKALIELSTTSDNLEYTVVEKGSSGFFGLFGKDVVIRAKKKKEENLEEEIFGDLKQEFRSGLKEERKPEKKPERKEKESFREPKKDFQKKEARKESRPEAKMEAGAEIKAEVRPEPKRPEGKPESKKAEGKAEAKAPKEEKPREEKPAEKAADARPIDAAACEKAAKDFLTQVFQAMGIQVELETVFHEKDRELVVNMNGDDMGILIGKRGQTLDSLQYLVSLVVNKETDGYLRVKLDTENYRARRKDTLETLARNIAYKVKRTRHSVSLEPMNPYERRIIHAALQNDRYLVTRSEGEEPFRHVVITLRREARENRGPRENRAARAGRGSRENLEVRENREAEEPKAEREPKEDQQ